MIAIRRRTRETRRHERAVVLQQLGTPLASVNHIGCPIGEGVPACRCYRCGCLLTVDTVTVDRIIPGCKGGTYRRNNIRPACATCNSSEGGRLAGKGKR